MQEGLRGEAGEETNRSQMIYITTPNVCVVSFSNCLGCSVRRAECVPRKELHVQMRFTLQVWSLIYGDSAASRRPSCLPCGFCLPFLLFGWEGKRHGRVFLGGLRVPYCCAGYSVAAPRQIQTVTVENLLTCPVYDLHPLLYGRPQPKSLYWESYWIPQHVNV